VRYQFRPPEAHRCPLTQLYYIASFQVKNNGQITVVITHGTIPQPPVLVPPGATSPPFTFGGKYSIRSELEHLPLPDPEIVITFSPEEQFEAKAINRPSVNVEIIAKFDFPKGEPSHFAVMTSKEC
jgi:hypothetical protein